jgi:hypothetical protein
LTEDATQSEQFYANVGGNPEKKWIVVKYSDDTTETFYLDFTNVNMVATTAATIATATLGDKSETNNIPNSDLYTQGSYTVAASKNAGDAYTTLSISIDGLKQHENDNHVKGYWVGVDITAPTDKTIKAYYFEVAQPTDDQALTAYTESQPTSEQFYANVGGNPEKRWIVVQYSDDTKETFYLDFTNVKTVAVSSSDDTSAAGGDAASSEASSEANNTDTPADTTNQESAN